MLALIFLLLPLPALSAEEDCANCNRRPAVQVAVPAIFPELGSRLDAPESCLEHLRKSWEKNTTATELAIFQNYLREAGELNPVIQALMKAPKPRSPGCKEAQDQRYLRAALEAKLRYLKEKTPEFTAVATSVAKSGPRYGAQKSVEAAMRLGTCLSDVPEAASVELDAANPCVQTTRIAEDLLGYLRAHDIFSEYLAPACTNPAAEKPSRAELLALVKSADAANEKTVRNFTQRWAQSKTTIQKLSREIPKALSRPAPPAPEDSCPLELARENAERASVILDVGETGRGTGFYLGAGNRHMLASARHVPGLAGRFDEPLHDVTPRAAAAVSFAVDAGRYDFSNDAVVRDVPAPARRLAVASPEERPQPGQVFIAAGFPAASVDRFSQVDCRFLGYGRNLTGGTTYLLHCPSREALNGMSGGPLVGEDGRAWGIMVYHHQGTDLVAATPISLDAGNDLKLGPQGVFLSDQCYGPVTELQPPHRCQIFPGSEESNLPLRGN